MTSVARAPTTVRRPATDVDWHKVRVWGSFTGLALVFVSAAGMVETLERRMMIDPWLTLGLLSLLWIPLVFGFTAASEEVLEGIDPPKKGARDLVAGLVTGLIGGAVLGVFIIVIDSFDLRDVFVRLGPELVELLTFGRGVAFGVVVWLVICGGLGLAGGGLHVVSPRVRRALTWALLLPLAVSLFQTAVEDIFENLNLESLFDQLYATNGGLTTLGTIVFAVAGGLIGWFSGGALVPRFRRHYASLEGQARTRWNLSWAVGILIAIVVLPNVLGGLTNELLSNVGLFLIMALGLNIVVGFAGLLDLGYVAFFAVGAYTAAVLTSPISPKFRPVLTLDFLSWEGWVVVGAVVLVGMMAGVLVGTPVIRMRGDYLAIVTLGFGEIVRVLFLSDWLAPVFGGAQGVRNVPSAQLGPIDIRGTNPQSIFYLVTVFVALAIYVSWRLLHSRLGRAWAALREDESVAETMGIYTVSAKLLAFVTGAILASLAGMVFAVKVGSVFPNSFKILVSIVILVVVIIGGMGSIPGVIVGSVVLIGVLGGPTTQGLLLEFGEFKLLVMSALLVFMMLQRPEGLWPSARRQQELHQDEFLQDAWLARQSDAGESPDGKVTVLPPGEGS